MLSTSRSVTPGPLGAAALAAPLVDVLREVGDLVAKLSPEQYTRRCGESFSNGTIGAHVRHCLDHARALVDGRAVGGVDYERRARDTEIERNPAAAMEEIRRLMVAGSELENADASEPLRVDVMPTRDGQTVQVHSTLGRELSFVLSHTVHHNALVRAMAVTVGVKVSPTFGYAQSTLAHLDGAACAR